MIRGTTNSMIVGNGKPRASGDDPLELFLTINLVE